MGSPSCASDIDPTDLGGELNDTERAVLGPVSVAEVRTLFSAYARDRLDSPIAGILFRAGRIDVVWGVALEDGREVVIKSHRMPVNFDAIAAARKAQRVLSAADFPCPEPLSGPDAVEGRVLTLETLTGQGRTPDARDPGNRRLLAEGLARHIA